MILQALHELYDRLSHDPEYEISPPGFSLQKVVFRVVLKPDGTLHAIEDARIKDPKGKPRPRQVRVLGHPKPSGSGLNPCILWDTSQYMLGYKPEDDDPERTAQAFAAFRNRHLELEQEVRDPAFSAVCRFLERWDPARATEWKQVLDEVGPGYGVFQILGQTRFVHQETAVEEWWLKQQTAGGDMPVGQCLVTGELAPISRLHPKIKRVGNQGEALLVSFNDPAYESYGKEQSFNAPVSEPASFRYTTALNALTDGPKSYKHRFSLGDATVVFWTKERTNTEDIFAQFAEGRFEQVSEVQDEDLRRKIELFLNALRQGREAYGELDAKADQTPFYLLGLTGQARGRIGVRFFYTNTLSALLDNLRRHYNDITVVCKYGAGSKRPDPEFPALRQMLEETAPRRNGNVDRESIPPVLEGPLLCAVITGAPYPAGLFSAVMRRIHGDREVNYVRACIIAGYLRRNVKQEVSMSLDTKREDPAYRLGRLFAVLEMAQLRALGRNINATIRDRFYSAASATPATVFPRLLRTYQHHLAKIEGGAKTYYERLAQDILGCVKEFPSHLNLAEQGLFALGYYHQMRELWTPKEDKNQKGEEQ